MDRFIPTSFLAFQNVAYLNIRQWIQLLGRRMEFGDVLMYFYFVVFIRQYLWGVETWTAWILTIPISFAAWFVYVSTREGETVGSGKSFWLIVAPPLILIYLMRVAIPDSSFDVWTLRLFHAERGLRGFLYWPGEFFPTSAPYNPAPDMLTGIFRHLLGYRLGTVVNLLVLFWVGQIIDKFLRPLITSRWTRAVCVLLILTAEHLLFEVNNYMVDLLALPLMLEATLITLNADSWTSERKSLARVAFLVGASIALKLTHVVMVAPLVVICAWRAVSARPLDLKRLVTTTLVTFIAFSAPLLPFMMYLYRETGSPVFPGYNDIFHSPYYPPRSGWDGRWGGLGPWEILAWPVLMFLEPGRVSELGVYSGRLAAGFIAAISGGLVVRRQSRIRTLCLIVVLASLLWSLTMGYVRYALYLEVLAGILIIALASLLVEKTAHHSWFGRAAIVAPLVLVLAAQATLACVYVFRTEWSGRSTVFQDFGFHVRESKYLMRDRSIRALLSEREREMFDRAEVWVVSGETTAGLMPLLNRRAPFVNVRTPEYFIMPAAREKYERALERFAGKRMYSFTRPGDFGAALFELRFRGLDVGSIQFVEIPFYSFSNRVKIYFFEIKRAGAIDAREPQRTRAATRLPESDYRAEISLSNAPQAAKPGEELTLFFRVRNVGGSVWPGLGGERNEYRFGLQSRWLDARAERSISIRKEPAQIFYDLGPGETMLMPLTLIAPDQPGVYTLDVDMFQEGVGPFADRGSQPLRLTIRVDR